MKKFCLALAVLSTSFITADAAVIGLMNGNVNDGSFESYSTVDGTGYIKIVPYLPAFWI